MLNFKGSIFSTKVLHKNYYSQIFKAFLFFCCSSLLVSCGGGSSTGGSSNPSITRLVVVGDSFTDVGTYGYKFTIQGSAATGVNSSQIAVDLISTSLNLTESCNYFVSPANVYAATYSVNPLAGCTNFSSGGGRVLYRDASSNYSPTDFRNISVQTTTAATVLGGYSSKDLVIAGVAGNDFADLLGSALAVLTTTGATQTAALTAFGSFVSTVIPAATVNATLSTVVDSTTLSAALAGLGAAYSGGIATAFNSTIQAGFLDLGAEKVIVFGPIPVTKTPRFNVILGAIEAASGLATRTAIDNLFNDWVATYNLTLESLSLNNEKVVFYDTYDTLNNYYTSPTTYGLASDVTTPACPIVGVGASGPEYNLSTCTEALAEATVGSTYKTYLYSDNFHPGIDVQNLISNSMLGFIRDQGW
jgi:phospholipase/lecithinase/hemolysin